tara:strand:- start:113120 stop:113284 length:165 start_codon:yes stop_codon:yes gene_type:complete
MKWLRRLRHEWIKNDGRPWEEWGPGPDLKDLLLRALCVVVGLILIGLLGLTILQ